MSGLVRFVELTAKARTGLSAGLAAWGAVGLLGALATVCFISVTAFVWIAQVYDPLTAAVALTGFYALVTLVAVIVAVQLHRSTVTRARMALAERGVASWLDPGLLAMGLQIGRLVGWRRIVPLALIAVIATGVSREWSQHRSQDSDPAAND